MTEAIEGLTEGQMNLNEEDNTKKTKPGKIRQYSPTKMLEAIQEVTKGKMNITKASIVFKVPRTTLMLQVKGWKGRPKAGGLTTGRKPALDPGLEEAISSNLQIMSQLGFGATKNDIRAMVGAFVQINKIRNPFKDGVPGKAWLRGFLKRWRLLDPSEESEVAPHPSSFHLNEESENRTKITAPTSKSSESQVSKGMKCVDIKSEHIEYEASNSSSTVNDHDDADKSEYINESDLCQVIFKEGHISRSEDTASNVHDQANHVCPPKWACKCSPVQLAPGITQRILYVCNFCKRGFDDPNVANAHAQTHKGDELLEVNRKSKKMKLA